MLILDGFPVLAGFFLGYLLKTPLLIAFTVVCVSIAAYLVATAREIEELIARAFIRCVIITNVTMWVTYYIVTDHGSIQEFLKTYILR